MREAKERKQKALEDKRKSDGFAKPAAKQPLPVKPSSKPCKFSHQFILSFRDCTKGKVVY